MNRPSNDAELLSDVLKRAHLIAARIGETLESGCWDWLGSFTLNGYGTYSLRVDGQYRSIRAHRAVFMLHHDRPVAAGLTLHHTCHRRSCVNPSHLVELTQKDNNAADATGGGSIQERFDKQGKARWAVLFREAGKQRSRTFATREDAVAFAAERQVAARTHG